MPREFGYVIDELLHVDYNDENKRVYYEEIIRSIIDTGIADKFIVALCELIQNLAIDSLHIIGDIFDRGPRADIIMNELMHFHDVDIQWGNHDVEILALAECRNGLDHLSGDAHIGAIGAPRGVRATTDSNPFRIYFQSIPRLEKSIGLSYRRCRGGLGGP